MEGRVRGGHQSSCRRRAVSSDSFKTLVNKSLNKGIIRLWRDFPCHKVAGWFELAHAVESV
jgi:hypothetical protein